MPAYQPRHPDHVQFFTNPWSRGQIVRWMLEETGAPYEQVVIAYGEEMTAPAYRSVNPMMKVPTIRHRGQVITETPAICAYLADSFPKAGLAPATGDRASYYRWLFFGAGPLEAAITDRALGAHPTTEQQRMAGYGSYDRMVDTLAGAVAAARPWILGEHFSAVDVYLGAHILWGTDFGTLEMRAPFLPYIERLRARPAYRKAKAIDDALIASMPSTQS